MDKIVTQSKLLPGYNTKINKTIQLGADKLGSYALVTTALEPCIEGATAWSVVQVPAKDGVFYVRQDTPDCIRLSERDNPFAKGKKIGNTNIYRVERARKDCNSKAGFDSNLLAVRRGDFLFTLVDRGRYPLDKYRPGEGTQAYVDREESDNTSKDSESYMELEFASPYREDIGADTILKVEWRIIKLKSGSTEENIAQILTSL